jgi:outer membrane protein assembly factor BamD
MTGLKNTKSMINLIIISSLLIVVSACSSTQDTTTMNAEEHFQYVMGFYEDGDYEETVKEFQTLLLQYPGSVITDDAQYYLGMSYFYREQFLLAAYEFSKLIRDIPASSFVPDAQFKLADSYFQLSPPYQLDQAYTKKAVEEFQAYIDFFPTSSSVDEAETKIKELNEKLAEKDYKSATIYEKMEYNRAALQYYTQVAETYHDTKYAPMALYKKIKIEYDRAMYTDALKNIRDFLSRYPDADQAQELSDIREILVAEGW